MPWVTRNPEMLGMLPMIISEYDGRPAAEQIEERYAHGGGYSPYGKGKWALSGESTLLEARLEYQGDRPLREIARIRLKTETVIVFEYAFVAILGDDEELNVTRMD